MHTYIKKTNWFINDSEKPLVSSLLHDIPTFSLALFLPSFPFSSL